MVHSVKHSDEFIQDVKIYASANSRSVPKQIEHWARIGKISEENPDLPYEFIRDILVGQAELDAGLGVPFTFE